VAGAVRANRVHPDGNRICRAGRQDLGFDMARSRNGFSENQFIAADAAWASARALPSIETSSSAGCVTRRMPRAATTGG